MPTALRVMLLLTALAAAGCAVSGPRARWEQARGGVEPAGDPRCYAVAQRLQPHLTPATLDIRVVRTEEPCAWAFADGSIYVSRGLLAILDEAELAAAVAHECGHLLVDRHLRSAPAAIAGPRVRGCGEAAADDAGAALLTRAGLDPALMPRMLQALHRAMDPHDPLRDRVATRIERLAPP